MNLITDDLTRSHTSRRRLAAHRRTYIPAQKTNGHTLVKHTPASPCCPVNVHQCHPQVDIKNSTSVFLEQRGAKQLPIWLQDECAGMSDEFANTLGKCKMFHSSYGDWNMLNLPSRHIIARNLMYGEWTWTWLWETATGGIHEFCNSNRRTVLLFPWQRKFYIGPCRHNALR